MGFANQKIWDDVVDKSVHGTWDIPEFQRGFVWKPEKVKSLVDSLWRDYPIGSLLVWNRPDYLSARAALGTQSPKLWIVDGQQRASSLCLIFGLKPFWWPVAQEWNEKLDEYDVLFNISSKIESLEFGLPNPVRRKEPNWVSVRKIVSVSKEQDLTKYALGLMKSLGKDISTDQDTFSDIHSKIRSIWAIRNREIITVDIAQGIEDVVQIFARLNQQGVQVKEADVYVALIAAEHPGWVRDELLPFVRDLEDSGFDLEPGIFIRTITGIGEGKANLKEVSRDFIKSDNFAEYWQRARASITEVLKRLNDKGILSSDLLLSKNSLIPFFVLYDKFGREQKFDKAFHWFLLANWDGRYSGSAISTLTEDFTKIKKATTSDEAIKSLEEPLNVPKEITPKELYGEYSKEDFVLLLTYLTIFKNGAKDWLSGVRIGYDRTTNVLNEGFKPEWHHFFPRGKRVLKGAGVPDERANAIANIAILNEKSNRVISSNPPDVYMTRLGIGKDLLEQQYIPIEPELWKIANYDKFLDKRAEFLSIACNGYLTSLNA